MPLGPLVDKLEYIVGAGLAAIAAGITVFAKGSKARAQVREDGLAATEAHTKSEWIEDQAELVASERRMRMAAEAREREMYEQFQRERGLRLLTEERMHRLELRVRRMVAIVVEARPDLRDWLVTEPAEFEAMPTPPPPPMRPPAPESR